MAERQSVLGPEEAWRDDGFRVPVPLTIEPRWVARPNSRRSVLGPDEQWRAGPVPAPFPRGAAVAALVVVCVTSAVFAGRSWVRGYEALGPGTTGGVGDRRVLPPGAPREVGLPYRDGQSQTWSFSLRNDGRFDVEVLEVRPPEAFLADLVSTRGAPAPGEPVLLEPGEEMAVTVTLRSARCERATPGLYVVLTGVEVRHRVLQHTRTTVVAVPEQLRVSRATPGSLPCPRPDVVEPVTVVENPPAGHPY